MGMSCKELRGIKRGFAAAALILLGTSLAAQAQNSGYPSYLGSFDLTLLGGWSSHPSLAIGGGVEHSNVDDGFNAGGRLEYGLKNIFNGSMAGFSVAADGLYNQSSYGGTYTGTHFNSTSAMFDLLYHVPTNSPLSFYGGAGVGAVHDNLDGPILHGSSSVFGWQALGGIEYALNDNTKLIAEYRYQNAHDANIANVGPVGNTSANLSFGVKFSL
jgi:opacity protein-like surface antigen